MNPEVYLFTREVLQAFVASSLSPLRADLEALQSEVEANHDHLLREVAMDRQRLARLEHGLADPKPCERDRGELLRALLAANGGKMLESEARKKMRLSPARFSELLVTLREFVEVRQYHLDKRKNVLVLK